MFILFAESIKMGTTVATNALLERKGEKTAFVVTKGLKVCNSLPLVNRGINNWCRTYYTLEINRGRNSLTWQ